MRHLGSLLLSVILAPVIWLLTGYGLSEYLTDRGRGDDLRWELAFGGAALLAAGVCYALLILPRLSPVGPVLAGLAFLGMVVWSTLDPYGSYLNTGLDEILGIANPLPYPAEGFAALLAVPLLATIFSPRRWRRYDRVPALYAGQPTHHAENQAGFPTGSPPFPPPDPYGAPGPYPPAWQPPQPPPVTRPGPARDEETTTRLGPFGGGRPTPADDVGTDRTVTLGGDTERPTEDLSGDTRPLAGTPPPPAAYPPPGHATPTAPPVDPAAPPDDPETTRRLT
jgi:hypothetical protein